MQELGYTNIAALELFEQELAMYEEAVKPHSNHFHDYLVPADLIKNALLRIVTAPQSDTYSFMRRLVTHMNDRIDEEYSDFAIRMMAAATKDIRANQLIMSVLYITRDVLAGDKVELTNQWLHLVDNNMAVYQFLKNYNHSDQKEIEETYSGNLVSNLRTWKKFSLASARDVINIGHSNYEVKLTGDVMQVISFAVDHEVHHEHHNEAGENFTITSEVILTPTIGVVAIDKSILFYDDAKAQLSAQGNRYIHGYDTEITLPGLFYSVALSIISSDSGKVWRVSEVNILPPSMEVYQSY